MITKPKPKEPSWLLRGIDGGLLVMGIMLLAVAGTAFLVNQAQMLQQFQFHLS